MPLKTQNPEIETPTVETSTEVIAAQEDIKQQEKEIQLQDEKESQKKAHIETKLIDAAVKSDTLTQQQEVLGELSTEQTEVKMNTWEKMKKFGADHRGKLLVAGGSIFGISKLRKRRKGKNSSEENAKESTGSTTTESTDKSQPTVVNVHTGEKKNWFQRNWGWLVGGGAAAGVGGYVFRDHLYKIPFIGNWLDKLVNGGLSFKESFDFTKGNILNNAKEDILKNNANLERDETSPNTVKAFGEKFTIDIEKRTIQGLDIRFRTYNELITTIVILGAARYNYRGKCNSDAPFSLSSGGGDIVVEDEKLVSGSSNLPRGTIGGGLIGGIAGVALGGGIPGGLVGGGGLAVAGNLLIDNNNTLSRVAPTLDKTENKQRIAGYLNGMNIWERSAGTDDEIKERLNTNNDMVNNKLKDVLTSIREKIDPNDKDRERRWGERNPNITNYKKYDNIFELKSRGGFPVYIETILDKSGNITSAKIEDIDITFHGEKGLQEALYLALFISKCEKELAGTGAQADAFEYKKAFDPQIRNDDWGTKKGIYFDEKNDFYNRKYSEEELQNNIPTLLAGKNMDIFITWMNTREDVGTSLWTKKEKRKGRTNTYIKNKESLTQTPITKAA